MEKQESGPDTWNKPRSDAQLKSFIAKKLLDLESVKLDV